jgi:hypothetical protein
MTILTNSIELARNLLWDNLAGRIFAGAAILGFVPFYFLTAAHAALTNG